MEPELWGCAIFGTKMAPLPQTNFFSKVINIILIYLLAPFIGQNLKKILPADPKLWGCRIEDTDIASFADDKTPYIIDDNIDGVFRRSIRNFV